MTTPIEGWVRLGIVLSALWITVVTGRLGYELLGNSRHDSHYVAAWRWTNALPQLHDQWPEWFDIEEARRGGVSDKEIVDALASRLRFDADRARADGVPERDIADELVEKHNETVRKRYGSGVKALFDAKDSRTGHTEFNANIYLAAALVPVIALWGLATLLFVSVRWVRGGFREAGTPRQTKLPTVLAGQRSNHMVCQKCAESIAANANFCPNCGSSLTPMTLFPDQATAVSHDAPFPGSTVSTSSRKFLIIGVLLLETVALFGIVATLFPKNIILAAAGTLPIFVCAVWIGFLGAGAKELKAHLGIRSHAGIFFALYIVSFIPLIYVRDQRVFADAQQQSVGMGIVFLIIMAAAALSYHYVAQFIRNRGSNSAGKPRVNDDT